MPPPKFLHPKQLPTICLMGNPPLGIIVIIIIYFLSWLCSTTRCVHHIMLLAYKSI